MINRAFSLFWQEEVGQDMVEYALLLGFVALAGVGFLSGIRSSISGIWTTISDTLSTGAS